MFVALDHNRTSTVGLLLDYMHSVDNTPINPFVLMRSRRQTSNTYIPEKLQTCAQLKPSQRRGIDLVQMFVAHGQRAEDLSIFLYSTLDVSVANAFITNTVGEMNMRNFQRFENKNQTESLTILNTSMRVMNVVGYDQLRYLIIVSCNLVNLTLGTLPNLELLDVQHNKLECIPEEITQCYRLKILRCSHNILKRLPIKFGNLQESLLEIECSYNLIKHLPGQITMCNKLKSLECDHNGLLDLPFNIGILKELTTLLVHNNKLNVIPLSVSSLSKWTQIKFHSNPLQNIPADFPGQFPEVRQYLKALTDDPVKSKMIKLVVVGQEAVGKTTLLRALQRSSWLLPRRTATTKTDGIAIKQFKLGNTTLRCFDCGGDVDFNETHQFFITPGAIYLVCFNLAEYCISTVERSSFLLGRLQMWLHYIFSKVPGAQVIIVGTHADHPALTPKAFNDIWELLRKLLVRSRKHHHRYFQSDDRLSDCLLCQPDSKCLRMKSGRSQTGFVNVESEEEFPVQSDTDDSVHDCVAFPHIVGYYEVSSIKANGNKHQWDVHNNASIQHLKEAIRELANRLQQKSPEIPRRWADVQESLMEYLQIDAGNRVVTLQQVAKLAASHGITDPIQLSNVLTYLKAQGSLLYFPQLSVLRETIILDPEWLANICSAVVSYKGTGFNINGFIHHQTLHKLWKGNSLNDLLAGKILTLLRHLGVCIPMDDKTRELFPCKLPLGEPDEEIWPTTHKIGERQVIYSVTCATRFPPSLFNTLLVSVYRARSPGNHHTSYHATKFVEWFSLDHGNCEDCGKRETYQVAQNYQVLFEIIPHVRTIQVTVRGVSPCCLLPCINAVMKEVQTHFEGLGTLSIDTLLCPDCCTQSSNDPQKYRIHNLRTNRTSNEKLTCRNGHNVSCSSLLCGSLNNSSLPLTTVQSHTTTSRYDYSGCPKLFVMLPVSQRGLTFDNCLTLFTCSAVCDGYAAHFLCEFPDGYHVTPSPGYRLKDPKDFMRHHGRHILAVIHLLKCMSGSTVSSHYATENNALTTAMDNIVKDYQVKFPFCNFDGLTEMTSEQLQQEIAVKGATIQRHTLRKQLNLLDRPGKFGPLHRFKHDQTAIWLCSQHYKQLRMLNLDSYEQDWMESTA